MFVRLTLAEGGSRGGIGMVAIRTDRIVCIYETGVHTVVGIDPDTSLFVTESAATVMSLMSLAAKHG